MPFGIIKAFTLGTRENTETPLTPNSTKPFIRRVWQRGGHYYSL